MSPLAGIDLSIIIPTYNRKDLVTRAVQSILDQDTSLTTEVIVTDDGSTDGTPKHLESTFSKDIQSGRLQIHLFENCGDCGAGRNRGAWIAHGKYLAFLDSDDYWKPGRLRALEPLLGSRDFIIQAQSKLPANADSLRLFVRMNWGIVSSAVLSRELFDQLGGFPEGYYRGTRRRALPGNEDYETWLKSILYLVRKKRADRIAILDDDLVVTEPQTGGIGRFNFRRQMIREALTLLRVSPQLPLKYWPLLARRLAGASKVILFNA